MGLDTESTRFLLGCRRRGTDFSPCLVLGRQHYFPGATETRALFQEFGLDPEPVLSRLGQPPARYADPVFQALGATRLETMDASAYEGASLVHDLNQEGRADWREGFSVVCDAGTLEHVFNFPVAIRNAMSMVRLGGDLILHTTANNYFGHGFYQFSPELLFRVLSAENGFQVTRMVAVEYRGAPRWFEVTDPEAIQTRVNLVNAHPVLLFVCARRVARVEILARPPQQSDYVALWDSSARQRPPAASRRWAVWLLETAPRLARRLENYLAVRGNRSLTFANRRAYRRLRGKERN